MSNTFVRALSGVGFAVVTLLCLLLNAYTFAAYVVVIMVFMMTEFYRMTMGKTQYKFSRTLAIIAAVILFLLIFAHCFYALSIKYVSLSIIPMLVVMINSLLVRDKTEFPKFAYIYTALLYIGAPLALSNLIAFKSGEFNCLILVCFFVIIWCSDIGAYIVGCTLGQKYGKKLCPAISPKKSWMGFWGGMFFSVLAVVVMRLAGMLNVPMLYAVFLAVIMHVAGVMGDLFESQWKRCFDLKDSGNVIPGHGGMLDRFDSTLFAVPFGAIYLSLFNLL